MSRPPRPHPDEPTHGELLVQQGRLHMLPFSWQALVSLQHELARDELGMVLPGGEGDFAGTLFELSALVAHVLGKYQDHYASEAYLDTAATTRSLLRHGYRLAYVTDPGLSASGVVAFTIGAALDGELPAGLALTSAAKGERKAQKYETTEARKVDARWNSIEPSQARVALAYSGNQIRVTTTGLELVVGEPIVLVENVGLERAQLHLLSAVEEDLELGVTTLTLASTLNPTITNPADWTLHARPREREHLFGWDADAALFPPSALASAGVYSAPSEPIAALPAAGYEPDDLALDEVLLARRVDDSLLDTWMLIANEGSFELVRVTQERAVEAVFHHWDDEVVNVLVVVDGNTQTDTLTNYYHRWIAAPSTALTLARLDDSLMLRSEVAPRATLLHEFELSLALASDEPNTSLLTSLLELDDVYTLEPGMRVVLSDRAGSTAELVELVRVREASSGNTEIEWKRVTSAIDHEWTLGDLLVLGNVVAVSHGTSRSEVLGDSDGSTANQRFILRKPRVTQLAGVDGAEPALTLRVGEVTWTRVVDFGESSGTDRHYRVEIDPDQLLHVVFGDGQRGAVPAKGRRHIVAEYRVGLGDEGNLAAGELTRLAQAHPLIEAVRNPLAITGGSEPDDAAAVQREATRWLRTFDRAVSTRDHADLALLYPGVARTNASLRKLGGIELVVADADGEPLADPSGLLAFMAARRDTSVPLYLTAPEAVPLHLSLELETDPAFNAQIVEDAIRAALYGDDDDAPGAFTFAARQLGEAAHLSQVHALLDALEGITFVRITHFSFAPATALEVHDVLRVEPRQWISLAASDLQLTSTTSSEDS